MASAVQTAKANRSVFIVFIAGEGAKTEEMENCLHAEEVTTLCEEGNCVAVKLAGGSNDCKFFSQIYPVVVIPSVFFIGDNGVPLEVIGECKSQQDFSEKVKKALEMQKSRSSSSAAPTQGAASSEVTSNAPKPTETEGEDSPVTAGEISRVPVEGAAAAEAGSGSGDDSLGLQATEGAESKVGLGERVDRAKELIEQKRQEKMKKEAEDERRREIERRNIGQGVQKLREQQKEMEMLEAKRELQKDKENDRIARQRVKEEIERDRAEKALKFNKQKMERAQAEEEARKKKLVEQQAALAEEQAKRSDTARIQFRMADGSFLTQQFPATDSFRTVQQFITQHLGSEVNLSTLFPRRTFTAEDEEKTLQELQLAPSAAILVIPRGQSSNSVRSSSDVGMLSSLSSLVLSPFVFIWNLLCSLFGLSGSPSASSSTPQQPAGSDPGRPSSSQRRPASSPASSRQEGAIKRFRNAQDDENDEDRNTWNGNSTQQM